MKSRICSLIVLLLLVVTTNTMAAIPKDRMFLGVYDPNAAFKDLPMDVQLGFLNWADTYSIKTFMNSVKELDRIPIVSIEPWTTYGSNVLLDVVAGKDDIYLGHLVEALNAYDGEFWLRWAQEPELKGLYPWGQGKPERYINAFRYVVNYLRANVTNPSRMTIVFPPAGEKNGADYYPGNDYTDMISITILSDTIWDTKLLGNTEPQLLSYFLTNKYLNYTQFKKPIFIGEMGVSRKTEEERQAWFAEAMTELKNGDWPWLVGIVYFNDQNAANIWTKYLPYWTVKPELFWKPTDMPPINVEGRAP